MSFFGLFKSWEEKGDDGFLEGRYQDAVNCYHEAIEQHPKKAKLYLKLGASLLQIGEPKQGISHLINSVILDPYNLEDCIFVIEAIAKRGLVEQAINLIYYCFHYHPNHPELNRQLLIVDRHQWNRS